MMLRWPRSAAAAPSAAPKIKFLMACIAMAGNVKPYEPESVNTRMSPSSVEYQATVRDL